MKDGSQMKGLVVEQHEDRVVLSTEQGEVPVLREKIGNIAFDDPEWTFMELGESNETAGRFGEALAYYEKALAANANLEDAKKAVTRVRNRFWSAVVIGPREEIEKRQALYDAWGKAKPGHPYDVQDHVRQAISGLREGLGLVLSQKGDWVRISEAAPRKDAALAGLRRNDRLVAMDGRSLRYLDADVVREKFLSPRYSNLTLDYERDCTLRRTGFERSLDELGMRIELGSQGLYLKAVKTGGPADKAGLKPGDLLMSVNGASTRYLPIKKLLGVVVGGPGDDSVLSVRRSVLLTRK